MRNELLWVFSGGTLVWLVVNPLVVMAPVLMIFLYSSVILIHDFYTKYIKKKKV